MRRDFHHLKAGARSPDLRSPNNFPRPCPKIARFSPDLACTMRPGSAAVPFAERSNLAICKSSIANKS